MKPRWNGQAKRLPAVSSKIRPEWKPGFVVLPLQSAPLAVDFNGQTIPTSQRTRVYCARGLTRPAPRHPSLTAHGNRKTPSSRTSTQCLPTGFRRLVEALWPDQVPTRSTPEVIPPRATVFRSVIPRTAAQTTAASASAISASIFAPPSTARVCKPQPPGSPWSMSVQAPDAPRIDQ